jgi:hypothetical protein
MTILRELPFYGPLFGFIWYRWLDGVFTFWLGGIW